MEGKRRQGEGRTMRGGRQKGRGERRAFPRLCFFFSHKLTTNQVYITGGPLATEN